MFVSVVFFFKQKTAYEMRISDWSSDVCSSDLGFTLEVLDDATEFSWRNHFMHLVNFAHEALLDKKVTRGQLQRSLNLYYDRAGYIDHYVLAGRSEEHTSELQSLMRNSYAVFCLKKKKT